MIPSDPNRPHIDYLFEQINATNGIMLNPVDFTVSPPEPYVGQNANTQVTITRVDDPTDITIVYYNRIDLLTALASQTATINLAGATLLSDIIGQINTAYSLDLLPTDFTDTPLPVANSAFPSMVMNVLITAIPNSLKYCGSYDYMLNFTATPVLAAIDQRRIYTSYNGMATLQESIVKYLVDSTIDVGFSFARNVTNVTAFSIQEFFPMPDGTLIVNGSFTCDVMINGAYTPGTFATLVCDSLGNVTATSQTKYFNAAATAKLYSNPKVPYVYAVDSAISGGASVTRYLETGVLDATFICTLPYTPEFIRIADSGNIYAASAPFIGPDPYTPALAAVSIIRVDRLTNAGMQDPLFATQYVRSSVAGVTPDISVLDIFEDSTSSVTMLLNSVNGCDIGTEVPVVNGHSLVSVDANYKATSPWTPIVSLTNTGLVVTGYMNSVNTYLGEAITLNPTPLNKPMPMLGKFNMNIVWMTYKSNPFTMQPSILPIFTDLFGNMANTAFPAYGILPVYASLYGAHVYSDGTIVMSGKLASIIFNGAPTPAVDLISIITPAGSVMQVTSPMPGSYPAGTISLNQVTST